MRRTGIFLILSSLSVTMILFLFAKDNPAVILQKPFLSISQISALLGMILFCYSFFLSSRFTFLENIFGGLDKVYKLHQITGRLSFILIINHFIFLIFNYINSSATLDLLLLPGKTLSYNLGILGLWSMCAILIAILYLKIDYQLFIRVQSFFIIPFVFGVLHMMFAQSDSSRYLPLTYFLLFHAAVAGISWVYRTFLYSRLGPRFEYKIEFVRLYPNDVTVVSLLPLNKKMSFLPGQFVYVKFESLGIKEEFHPFSIASSPFENRIVFAIKALGDFTTQVKMLKAGEKAVIMGPYGKFCERFFEDKDVVCIAGGIGITPFLGILNYCKDKQLLASKNLFLFYSTKNEHDILFEDYLKGMVAPQNHLSLKVIHTEKEDRLNVDFIKNTIGDLKDKLYFLCGPKIMMEDLAGQLKNMNVSTKNIIFEDFQFK